MLNHVFSYILDTYPKKQTNKQTNKRVQTQCKLKYNMLNTNNHLYSLHKKHIKHNA